MNLWGLLFGGGIPKVLLQAYQAKLDAKNDEARLEAEQNIARIEAARAIAAAEAQSRWSATSIGRLLIVVPYGIWWTAVYTVSTFHIDFVVQAPPQDVNDMAKFLIPAILIASVAERKIK